MSIRLRHHSGLELNLVEYAGAMTLGQLEALAGYAATNPAMLRADTLAIVHADADFSAVDLRALDLLYGRYRALYGKLSFQIYRRSAWLCLSPSAHEHVAYWVGAPDMREAMSSTVRQFDNLAEAGDWLLLSPTEIAAAETGEGFADVAYFEEAARAAAR